MSSKKISNVLSLIEIAENNLKTARALLLQMTNEKGIKITEGPKVMNSEESQALEVQEGYFDGESMIGDNGQTYTVPQNYASKTQLIIGDRMKWILTPEREIFKLIAPANRERVIGTFTIEGDNFIVLVDKFPEPVQILKASATFAMKNLGLQIGDEVAVIVPKDHTPIWGAFSSVVKSLSAGEQERLRAEHAAAATVAPAEDYENDISEFTGQQSSEAPAVEQNPAPEDNQNQAEFF